MSIWPQVNPLIKDWFDVEPGKTYRFPNPFKSTNIMLCFQMRRCEGGEIYPNDSTNLQFYLPDREEIFVQCAQEFCVYGVNGFLNRWDKAQVRVIGYPIGEPAQERLEACGRDSEGRMIFRAARLGATLTPEDGQLLYNIMTGKEPDDTEG